MVKGKLPKISEVDLVRRIGRWALPTAASGASLVLGIGDDCAIYRPARQQRGSPLTTDLLIEDVHFRRTTHRPQDAGWRCLAARLSDYRSRWAGPRFCLLSLAVARRIQPGWQRSTVDCFGWLTARSCSGRRRFGESRKSDLRHRGVRRRSPRVMPCGETARGRAMRSMSPGRWAARHWDWRPARARHGSGMRVPSRASHWADSSARNCAPPRRWI